MVIRINEGYQISKEELEDSFIGRFWTRYNELIQDLKDWDCEVLDDDYEYIDFECDDTMYRANLVRANSTIAIKSIEELGDIDEPEISNYYDSDDSFSESLSSIPSDVDYLLSKIENKYGFEDMNKCLDFLLDHCDNIDEIEDGSGGYDLENAEYDINDSAIIRILRTYLKDRVINY